MSRMGRLGDGTAARRLGLYSGPGESSAETRAPFVRMPESGWPSSGFTLKDRAAGQIKVGPGRGRLHLKIIVTACTFLNELSFPLGSRNRKFSPLR